MLLVGNGRVVTRDQATPFVEDGAVVVEGTTIVEVGELAAMRQKYAKAEFVDARGGLIMPGLINCHTHIYSGLARGLAIKGCNPTNFLENLEQQWWNIDRHLSLDGTRACAYVTMMESFRNGVTTLFDHHASFFQIPGSLFAIKDVAKEMGMRACLCYEVSDRDGAQKLDESIKENADFARWAAQEDSDMIAAMFGGHALFTLPDEALDKMVQANDGLTGFHIHVCEGTNDVYDSAQKHGCTSIHRLLDHGILGEKTMLGHCIHITPADMELVANTHTKIVNNPQSNANNAVGTAPVLEFFKHGITVTMGTDAYTHDMLQSLKAFVPLQRLNATLPNVAWGEAMDMLFRNNAEVANMYFSTKSDGKPLGVLKAGAAADIAVFDYPAPTPLGADNIDGHILFGVEGHDCRTTIVNGRVVYRDRELVGCDRERIDAFVMQEAKKLWGDLNGCAY
ncbi:MULTISPECIES: putative aminohydrolase SsnA [Atopobiaceae]|uniref:Selenium metabolism protein SsnA n=1 Tax=Parafannyhessea umbonata TaxID=604330 RepID=A0A1H9QTQ6_9ACTN|nr:MULTISPECIES: putative aminohydrolase SsnA [Atopobiaceae]SEH44524.1 putative selenium metabolism protein SsnA [Parafannyhessea umbonata]SER63757.1 putative selenium metabolism protein SsnA [Parafannyhessea umbonata]SJZ60389.1 putative selenium metabolism protein SsnA [Olsenella sp. KH1P3]